MKIHKYLILILIAFFVSCNKSNLKAEDLKSCVLRCDFKNFDGVKSVSLVNTVTLKDTLIQLKNSSFDLQLNRDSTIYYISFHNANYYFISDDKSIDFSFTAKGLNIKYSAKDSQNKDFAYIDSSLFKLNEEMYSAKMKSNSDNNELIAKLQTQFKNIVGGFVISHISSKAILPYLGDSKLFTDKQFLNFINNPNFNKDFAYNPLIVRRIDEWKSHYVDFSIEDAEGQVHRLSDYKAKSKYILLVFWGPWCHYCVGDLPQLQRLYNEFPRDEFNIISITDASSTQRAIDEVMKEKNITNPWPNFIDRDNTVLSSYKIRNYPTIYLIGPDSKVIDSNVHPNSYRFSQDEDTRLYKYVKSLIK